MRYLSRRRPVIFALLSSTLAIACAAALIHDGRAASAGAPAAVKPSVTISNYSFHPATLTVKVGATVTWANKDGDVHTIKSTDGPEVFGSPALDSGDQFKYTFRHAGTYHYICSVHPYMRGMVVVR
jgi:plastocyanin